MMLLMQVFLTIFALVGQVNIATKVWKNDKNLYSETAPLFEAVNAILLSHLTILMLKEWFQHLRAILR